MSGHSKWSTIKRKKALVDAKRSKVWTKVIKEITVAARMGGGDADGNPRLRMALDKAKAANCPKDSVKRAIDKATGTAGGADYDEVVYEGYGPGGIAIVLECMTDNRNRTVSEVRHGLHKFGGTMANNGSVSWMFHKRGVINVLKADATEEQLMEIALEAGAEDIRDDGEVWTIDTDAAAFLQVKDAIEGGKIAVAHSEIDNIPETSVALDEDHARTILKLVASLEDLDDVQNVYANYEISDELMERLDG